MKSKKKITGAPECLHSATGCSPVPDTEHVCWICGHRWYSPTAKRTRDVKRAAIVNKTGPYCSLCQHLKMASRLQDVVKAFLEMRIAQVKWRWRIWKDYSDPKQRVPTEAVFDDWQDAANECAFLNKRDGHHTHWCRIIEAAT